MQRNFTPEVESCDAFDQKSLYNRPTKLCFRNRFYNTVPVPWKMSHRLEFPRIYAKFSDGVSLFQELFPILRLDGTLTSYDRESHSCFSLRLRHAVWWQGSFLIGQSNRCLHESSIPTITFLFDYKMITQHILVCKKFTAVFVFVIEQCFAKSARNSLESEGRHSSFSDLLPTRTWDSITFGHNIYGIVWFPKEAQQHSEL